MKTKATVSARPRLGQQRADAHEVLGPLERERVEGLVEVRPALLPPSARTVKRVETLARSLTKPYPRQHFRDHASYDPDPPHCKPPVTKSRPPFL